MKKHAARAPILHDAGEVKSRAEPLHDIWWQGRQWAVTSYGIEARDGRYVIEKARLTEGLKPPNPYSWVRHVGQKTWVDLTDFSTAFFVAVAMHGRRLDAADMIILEIDFRRALRSEIHHRIYHEMFPADEAISPMELDRRCTIVDEEIAARGGNA